MGSIDGEDTSTWAHNEAFNSKEMLAFERCRSSGEAFVDPVDELVEFIGCSDADGACIVNRTFRHSGEHTTWPKFNKTCDP